MKNKQLDTKDLLMNKKEELIWRVIDNVINCCAVTRIDEAKSITREYVVGKSGEEKIRRMKMEIQELEECLDKYEERDNRYDDDPQYRSRNPYDDEERYHEREEYGHRERGRYGRY